MMYWFGDTLRHGDGRVPEVGITHTVEGLPVLCEHGLHASERALDALNYAGCMTLWGVELGGVIVRGEDKACATERTYLWWLDAEAVLRAFARWCALSAVSLWDMPEVVRQYLETGDESIRNAAMTAAWDVAKAVAMDAAKVVAWSVARDAPKAVAWSVAKAAASAAAWNAAYSAAMDAAREARTAAKYAAANWEATRDAAWNAQATQLEAMIAQARAGQTEWTWRLVDGRVQEVQR